MGMIGSTRGKHGVMRSPSLPTPHTNPLAHTTPHYTTPHHTSRTRYVHLLSGKEKSPSTPCNWAPRAVISSVSRPSQREWDSKAKSLCCRLKGEEEEEEEEEGKREEEVEVEGEDMNERRKDGEDTKEWCRD